MNHIPVYQTDPLGFFLYEDQAHELLHQPGDFNIPYGAVTVAPPAAPAGHVQRLVDGEWVVVEDHRKDVLYVVESGAPYQIGSTVEVDSASVTYDGGGPVPDWLTTVPPVVPEAVDPPAAP